MTTRRRSTFAGAAGACTELATWRKSTFSSPNVGVCLELATWRRSSRSGGGNDDVLGVRDSKRPAAGALVLPGTARRALLDYARRA